MLQYKRCALLCRQLLVDGPLRLLLMSFEWFTLAAESQNMQVGMAVKIFVSLCRFYRVADLWGYFTACQQDVATDVRWVAFFKCASTSTMGTMLHNFLHNS
jgi:hypothetical protein